MQSSIDISHNYPTDASRSKKPSLYAKFLDRSGSVQGVKSRDERFVTDISREQECASKIIHASRPSR